MEKWLKVSLLLCSYGFLREMRPSEPFVTEYLSSDRFEMDAEQLNREIYPLGTYSVLAELVIVFLVTDILRYKPMIVLSACAGATLMALLSWTTRIWEIQIAQVFYGLFMATEVAYYTYIYAKVDRERYSIVSGHTRSAILSGRFLGSVLAQVLISTEATNYRGLHFISFSSQIASLVIALSLPSVKQSIYFYREPIEGSDNKASITDDDAKAENRSFSWRRAFALLWQHAVSAYTNHTVIRWSLWWAFATCGQLMVLTYVQILWKEIALEGESFFNGGIEAASTLLGAISAFGAGFISNKRNSSAQMWIITIFTLLMGSFLMISSFTNLIWVAYIMYVLFCMFYSFVITIAASFISSNLSEDSFGLIFGINTLMALLLQSIMTLVLLTDNGFSLLPRTQFIVYGAYYLCLGLVYALIFLIPVALQSRRPKDDREIETSSTSLQHN